MEWPYRSAACNHWNEVQDEYHPKQRCDMISKRPFGKRASNAQEIERAWGETELSTIKIPSESSRNVPSRKRQVEIEVAIPAFLAVATCLYVLAHVKTSTNPSAAIDEIRLVLTTAKSRRVKGHPIVQRSPNAYTCDLKRKNTT